MNFTFDLQYISAGLAGARVVGKGYSGDVYHNDVVRLSLMMGSFWDVSGEPTPDIIWAKRPEIRESTLTTIRLRTTSEFWRSIWFFKLFFRRTVPCKQGKFSVAGEDRVTVYNQVGASDLWGVERFGNRNLIKYIHSRRGLCLPRHHRDNFKFEPNFHDPARR